MRPIDADLACSIVAELQKSVRKNREAYSILDSVLDGIGACPTIYIPEADRLCTMEKPLIQEYSVRHPDAL